MAEPRPQPLLLTLADGWRNARPRQTGYALIWQESERLYCSATDFTLVQSLGDAGPVDCPLAFDGKRTTVYRYVCPPFESQRDFSELRAFDLAKREVKRIFTLDKRKWIVWMCKYLPKRDCVLGLVATTLPGSQLHIQHQMGFFDLNGKGSLLVNLPKDAFSPLAVDEEREQALFHGAEGYQLLDFHGSRKARLSGSDLPEGRGASFHPVQPIVALGGGKIMLWHLKQNRFETLHKCGVCPVWFQDGRRLFFRESSSDLMLWDGNGGVTRMLDVAGAHYRELHYAECPVQSPCGRYVAVGLCRRVRVEQPQAGEEPFLDYHSLAVLDFEEQQVWQRAGRARNVVWWPLE